MLRDITRSLGLRLILRYELSNGKGTSDLAHGTWGVCTGQGQFLEDPGIDGRIILKCILEKSVGGTDWSDLVEDRDRW
jgi:hypothetical protein